MMIAIVGPTATGKSDLAMYLAEKYRGEIIGADSQTIYRHMDIGTAKPSPQDRARVAHHLIDICDPGETLGVALYKKLADAEIIQILSRNNVPFLVGGSGLYIDSVLFDYHFPLLGDLKYRAELEQLNDDLLLNELRQKVDRQNWPVDMKNRRRVVRAIETAGQGRSKRNNVIPNTLVLGITVSKEVAQHRIVLRIHKMLQQGLINEIAQIGAKFGWESPALNVIGYSEFKYACLGEKTIEQCMEDCVRNSMALFKKQMTWFKRNQEIQWIDNENFIRAKSRADALVSRFVASRDVAKSNNSMT
jgi:tRNA dimethylallyltransferase